MTKKQVINQLAKQKTIENILNKFVKCHSYKDDLAQDLYISLLEKPDDQILKLYESGQLNYFIVGMIRHNIISKTSPFYKQYKKFQDLTDSFANYTNI